MPSRSGSLSKQTTPATAGAIPRIVIDLAPLAALAVLFFSSDSRFTFIADEATQLNSAVQPLPAILAAHGHPPLYDLFLHIWLAVTGGAPTLLRVPSIAFF